MIVNTAATTAAAADCLPHTKAMKNIIVMQHNSLLYYLYQIKITDKWSESIKNRSNKPSWDNKIPICCSSAPLNDLLNAIKLIKIFINKK